ncbi:MAG: kinase-like domain-containing protein, partial [Linnemannia elongata]
MIESDQIGLEDRAYEVIPKSKRRDQERLLENKRRQGKLLLVSLLDNFCLLYDQSPERNRKLFYVICKTLSNMGIIDEEYLEEMSAVRSSYQRAFRSLVLSALTSIKKEQMILESRSIMAPPSTPTEGDLRNRRGSHSGDINSRGSFSDSFSSRGIISASNHLHTPPIDNATFPTTAMMRTLSFGDMFDNDPTRYKHDFVEIGKLGKGGFASVFKARNKLDGIEYAIKKVRLRGGAKVRYEKIFREIKFLARLDHKNVIRYYSSWLEHADYPGDSRNSRSGLSNSYSALSSSIEEIQRSLPNSYSGSGLGSRYGQSQSGGHELDPLEDELGLRPFSYPHRRGPSGKDFIITRDLTLFIQMQLCQTTLQDYLVYRNERPVPELVDQAANQHIFRAIVEGVAYIHDQDMIHRDLKPSNIFLGMPEHMRTQQQQQQARQDQSLHLGNLELRSLLTSNVFVQLVIATSGSRSSRTRTTAVGTVTYASPEQLARPNLGYDQKADIYSLGIIFFELYHPFSTLMERHAVLRTLRNGELPPEFVSRWPKEAAFVLWLMAEDPRMRPSAREIL